MTERLARQLLQRKGPGAFSADLEARRAEVRSAVEGRSFLLVGGAGSVGQETLCALLEHRPARVDVVDLSENGLAHLARRIRAGTVPLDGVTLRFFVLDAGTPMMERLLDAHGPYDGGVLSFMALKHVRSEKDPFTLQRMLETNVLNMERLLAQVEARDLTPRLFSVSTDKAADPTSVMGASKRLMEAVLTAPREGTSCIRTTVRFANVAFSSGSLLDSWRRRLEDGRPLACPADTWRYFVTPREAGTLCLLSALCLPDGCVGVPRGATVQTPWRLDELAVRFLQAAGFRALCTESEDEARKLASRRRASDPYPLYISPRDTSGEKAREVFLAGGETLLELPFHEIGATRPLPIPERKLHAFLQWIRETTAGSGAPPPVEEVVARMTDVVPGMRHLASTKTLDERM